MKVYLMYDTQFGNGKMLAQALGKEFPSDFEIKSGDVKDINPQNVAKENIDVLVLGGAIRMFRGATKSKKWLRELNKILRRSGNTIKYATEFLTHGLPTDKVQGFVKRYHKKLKKASNIKNVYPEVLTARVEEQEGPILDTEIEKAHDYIHNFIKWIQK